MLSFYCVGENGWFFDFYLDLENGVVWVWNYMVMIGEVLFKVLY